MKVEHGVVHIQEKSNLQLMSGLIDTTVVNTITQVIVILVHGPDPFAFTDTCVDGCLEKNCKWLL